MFPGTSCATPHVAAFVKESYSVDREEVSAAKGQICFQVQWVRALLWLPSFTLSGEMAGMFCCCWQKKKRHKKHHMVSGELEATHLFCVAEATPGDFTWWQGDGISMSLVSPSDFALILGRCLLGQFREPGSDADTAGLIQNEILSWKLLIPFEIMGPPKY